MTCVWPDMSSGEGLAGITHQDSVYSPRNSPITVYCRRLWASDGKMIGQVFNESSVGSAEKDLAQNTMHGHSALAVQRLKLFV